MSKISPSSSESRVKIYRRKLNKEEQAQWKSHQQKNPEKGNEHSPRFTFDISGIPLSGRSDNQLLSTQRLQKEEAFLSNKRTERLKIGQSKPAHQLLGKLKSPGELYSSWKKAAPVRNPNPPTQGQLLIGQRPVTTVKVSKVPQLSVSSKANFAKRQTFG